MITIEVSHQEQQRDILIQAINEYLAWRDNKSTSDGRGYAITILTWFHHFTDFGKNRANGLKRALSADPIPNPIVVLQAHFRNASKLNNHSLDTYLLESLLKNPSLFPVTNGFVGLTTQRSREALRRLIMDLNTNIDPEKAFQDGRASEEDIGTDHHLQNACTQYAISIQRTHDGPNAVLAAQRLDVLLNSTQITAEELTNVGLLYQKGSDGITRDYAKAQQWFKKACEKGCATAHYNLGFMHEHAYGSERDVITAARYYQLAINRGCILAKEQLKNILESKETTADELTIIASMYHDGSIEAAPNWPGALALYQQASQRGSPAATLYLGHFYQTDHGSIRKDKTLAFRSYLHAAKLGHPDAIVPLDVLGEEVSAENQLALGQFYGSFFHNEEKALYWRNKGMEVAGFKFIK